MGKLSALIVCFFLAGCFLSPSYMTRDISERSEYRSRIGRVYETKRDHVAIVFTDFDKKEFNIATIPGGTILMIHYVYLVNGSKTYFADVLESADPNLKDRIIDTSGWIDYATNKRRWGPAPEFKRDYVREIKMPVSFEDFSKR